MKGRELRFAEDRVVHLLGLGLLSSDPERSTWYLVLDTFSFKAADMSIRSA